MTGSVHAQTPAGPVDAGHEVEHRPDGGRGGQRRALSWALTVNAALMVLEIVGGLVFGSLALIADGAHLLSDVAALGIALAAAVLASRPASARHTFGLARAEVLAAQVSALLMLAAGVWIVVEAISRLREPSMVNGAGLAWVALIGLVVNAGSAVLLHHSQGESLNMRASVAHMTTDAAGSLAAVIAGVVIVVWGWTGADAVASVATAVLVLWAGAVLLLKTTHVLMEGSPAGLDPDAVTDAIRAVPGVVDVHHLHLWNLASDVPACSAHLVLAGSATLADATTVADRARRALRDGFALGHVTLETEVAQAPGAAERS